MPGCQELIVMVTNGWFDVNPEVPRDDPVLNAGGEEVMVRFEAGYLLGLAAEFDCV